MHKYKMMLFGGVSKNGKIAGSGRQQERFGVTMPVSRDDVFLCSSMSKRNLFAIFEAHNDCLATFFKDQKKFLIVRYFGGDDLDIDFNQRGSMCGRWWSTQLKLGSG
jgi:hypothetical protein